jgi:hypothetical protein
VEIADGVAVHPNKYNITSKDVIDETLKLGKLSHSLPT